MMLPGAVKDANRMITEPGNMLIFAAVFSPICGKQILCFLDKVFSERPKTDATPKGGRLGAAEPVETAYAV